MGSVLHPESGVLSTWDEWVASSPDVDRWVRTSREPVPAPDVVVLKRFGERPPRRVVLSRSNLARRDEWSCQYCGEPLVDRRLTLDHVVPRSRAGASTWENLVAACPECNLRKADRTPDEAGMPLRRRPTRPRWRARLEPPNGVLRPSWEPFLAKA